MEEVPPDPHQVGSDLSSLWPPCLHSRLGRALVPCLKLLVFHDPRDLLQLWEAVWAVGHDLTHVPWPSSLQCAWGNTYTNFPCVSGLYQSLT